jgi:hypothetical protein
MDDNKLIISSIYILFFHQLGCDEFDIDKFYNADSTVNTDYYSNCQENCRTIRSKFMSYLALYLELGNGPIAINFQFHKYNNSELIICCAHDADILCIQQRLDILLKYIIPFNKIWEESDICKKEVPDEVIKLTTDIYNSVKCNIITKFENLIHEFKKIKNINIKQLLLEIINGQENLLTKIIMISKIFHKTKCNNYKIFLQKITKISFPLYLSKYLFFMINSNIKYYLLNLSTDNIKIYKCSIITRNIYNWDFVIGYFMENYNINIDDYKSYIALKNSKFDQNKDLLNECCDSYIEIIQHVEMKMLEVLPNVRMIDIFTSKPLCYCCKLIFDLLEYKNIISIKHRCLINKKRKLFPNWAPPDFNNENINEIIQTSTIDILGKKFGYQFNAAIEYLDEVECDKFFADFIACENPDLFV